MQIKNMTNSRLDVFLQGGKKRVIPAGKIADLPASFIESGVGKNLKKRNKIAVLAKKGKSHDTGDGKKSKSKK